MTGSSSDLLARTKSRDIAKVLRKLVQPGVGLFAMRDTGHCQDRQAVQWCLGKKVSGAAGKLQNIPDHLIFALRSSDLIEAVRHNHWKISPAGLAWLKRHLSGSDPFQAQQMQVVKKAIDLDGVSSTVSVDLSESPLAWLRHRRGRDGESLIDDAQFSAGERLRSDFTRAHMSPRVTTNWSAIPDPARQRGMGGGGADMLDSAIEAGKRFKLAIDAVGPELSDILIDVCCFLKGLEETEARNSWPRRSAKLILQIALTRLARHYGLSSIPYRRYPQKGKVRHWGADDFKPVIDGEV